MCVCGSWYQQKLVQLESSRYRFSVASKGPPYQSEGGKPPGRESENTR